MFFALIFHFDMIQEEDGSSTQTIFMGCAPSHTNAAQSGTMVPIRHFSVTYVSRIIVTCDHATHDEYSCFTMRLIQPQ